MGEITAITPQAKDKTRCNVYIDGRFCCGLTMETVVKNRLKPGQSVSPERLEEMQLESEKNTAFDKALTHLSATRKTEKEIRTYLEGKGYLPAVIDYALEKLKGYDFVNDGDYAHAYVEFSAKKKGGRLIRMELRKKGVDDASIEGALEDLDEQTETDTAREILQKYMRGKTADKPALQKAFRYLLGKGFDADVIRSVLRAFGDCEDE